jgi:hypothetical protein
MPDILPSGTVIFLFTDIESSTPLWDREPQAMRLAAAPSHGGHAHERQFL